MGDSHTWTIIGAWLLVLCMFCLGYILGFISGYSMRFDDEENAQEKEAEEWGLNFSNSKQKTLSD